MAADIAMDESQGEKRTFTLFDKKEEFLVLQGKILAQRSWTDGENEGEDRETFSRIFMQISAIFDEYLEQAYLLDAHLESLLTPVVHHLKAVAKEAQSPAYDEKDSWYAGRVAFLLYLYVKFRGYKTITRYFPHEIADLDIALGFLLLPDGPATKQHFWSLAYVTLLWLSLICMLPFDLEQFDEVEHRGRTAANIESVAKRHLDRAGVDRDAAAILLSRLYMRKDMTSKYTAFVQWTKDLVHENKNIFSVMGALRVLCEVTKSGSADLVEAHVSVLLAVVAQVSGDKHLVSNTVIRKYRTKLISRVVLRLLPAPRNRIHHRAKILTASLTEQPAVQEDPELDIDVPEETESVLEELFSSLQDKDTVVRYSAAKGIARIAERLPSDFREQILDNVLQLYTIHSIALAQMYELPTVAEATWHGASLACAELARRGLIADTKLHEVLQWQGKALYFDIRQGSHSIGSSVRDAASYVVWSLARAQSVEALAPFIVDLSQRLVTVSIYDREIHIRRAASAAFQECVGRTNLCPHGISVLGKTDFYSVGLKRNAFLVAARDVAVYEEYRPILVSHVIGVTLRHWDPVMRQLGAQSLREICRHDMASLAPNVVSRVAEYLTFPDASDVHGAVLTLTELAVECGDRIKRQQMRKEIFSYLETIPSNLVLSPRHPLLTAAACKLIAASIALEHIDYHSEGKLPSWRKIVEFGLTSKDVPVQEAAAEAMAAISKLLDCSAVTQSTLIEEAKQPFAQQALCRMLGLLDYDRHDQGLMQALRYLLDSVDRQQSTSFLQNVEARRNAYVSLSQILGNVVPRLGHHLTPSVVREVTTSLLAGLEDYTTDERGDVGSWIRMACIKSLTDIVIILLSNGEKLASFIDYLPPAQFHDAIGGILKQGVERLDNVRQHAGQQLLRILELRHPDFDGSEQYKVHGLSLMRELFLSNDERIGWHEGSWLFPRVVRLLEIVEYRKQLLSGVVMSVSCRTDSTQRPISTSLVNYAKSLPTDATGKTSYSTQNLAEDLVAQCSQNLTANSVVIPVLQTLNVLLEGDVFESLYQHPTGCQSLQTAFSIVSRNVSKVKSVQRILASMRVIINMLPIPALRAKAIQKLPEFLAHRYPKIRADTAEYLYLVLQTKDIGYETDEAEDVILETEWSVEDLAAAQEAAQQCVKLLSQDKE